MVRFGGLFLILVAASQEDAGREVREQVARLRADRIEEREDAERALRRIGPPALPVLRAAARDADPDFSRRATRLARIIEVVRLLGPRVLEKIPGAEERIGSSDDRDWTDLFLKAHAMPGAAPAALEVLAPRALAGAGADPAEDRRLVVGIIAERGLRSVVPGLLSLLSGSDDEAKECAALALGHLRVVEAIPLLRKLLQEPNGSCRAAAVIALGSLGTPDVIPDLARAVTDPSPRVYGWASEALLHVPPAPAIAELIRLLDEKDLPCRGNVAVVLELLRRDEGGAGPGFSADDIADVERSAIEVLTEPVRPGLAERLVPLLRHPRAVVRRSAVILLSRAEARQAGGDVVPLLRDPDVDVRRAAVEAVADLETASAADALLELLRDPDPRLQTRAAYSLCRLKIVKALPDLLTLLAQGNPETKRWIAWGLGDLVRSEDAPALLRALEDSDGEVREAVVRLLWTVDPVAAVPSIVRTLGEHSRESWSPNPIDGLRRSEVAASVRKHLEDPEGIVRLGAVRLAVKAGLHEAVAELRRLTDDPDPDLRSEAVQAMSEFLRRRSIPLLVSKLWDDNDSLRGWIAWRLLELGAAEQAVPELLRFLDERGFERPVVDVLTAFHAREAIPALTKLLKKNAPAIRLYALSALVQLQAPPGPDAIRELLEDPDPALRKVAVDAIAAQKLQAAVPDLWACVRTGESELRVAALSALAAIQGAEASRDLMPLLEDDDPLVREAAARTLGRLKERRAIPMLRELLTDHNSSVRQGAARVLGELGSTESVPDLLRLLRWEEGMGQTAPGAVEALARLDAREAVPDLIRHLEQGIRLMSRGDVTVAALQKLDPVAAGRALLRLLEQEDMGRAPFTGALAQLQDASIRGDCRSELPVPPRLLAVQAIRQLGVREAMPALLRLARGGEERVRQTAAVTFIQLAGPGQEAEVLPMLTSPHDFVKIEALRRLASLGDRKALAPSLALLDDPSDDVRRAAVAACARLGGAEVLPRLRSRLDDRDPGVRVEAASWLCRFGDVAGVPVLVREGRSMVSLNAIRSPDLWRRLAETPLTETLAGTEREVLAEIARRGGLSLEIPDILPASIALGLEERRTVEPDGKRTLLDAMIPLLPRHGMGSVILDEGRCRLVLRSEEWKFWETWSEQAKR